MAITPDEESSSTLRCGTCGATLPAHAPRQAAIACPSCTAITRIDEALLERLRAHEGSAQHYRREVHSATNQAVAAKLTRSLSGRWAIVLVASWILAGAVTLADTPLATFVALAIFVAPFVALVVHSKRVEGRLRTQAQAEREPEPLVHVRCSSCGGQNELQSDAAVLACAYCRVALAPDEQALASSIAAARSTAERERWRAIHQGWRTAAHGQQDPRTDLVPFFVIGGLGSLWVVGTLVTAVRMAVGAVDVSRLGELGVMLGISLLIVIGVGPPLWHRRRRSRAWTAALDVAATRTGARVRRSSLDLVEWLIAHWRDQFDGRQLGSGRAHALLCSDHAPLWALSIDPLVLKNGSAQPRLRLIVPGDPHGAVVQRFIAAAEHLGLHASTSGGGMIAALTGDAVAVLHREPVRLVAIADAIADAAYRLPGRRLE